MKICINVCYGGFGLSPKAIKRLSELRGHPCYFFKIEYTAKESKYTPISIEEIDTMFWSAFKVQDPDAKEYKYSEINIDSSPGDRADPLLIQVIEELGKAAHGNCAKLKIVEIPDGTAWQIDDYDGMERVEESHRSWS